MTASDRLGHSDEIDDDFFDDETSLAASATTAPAPTEVLDDADDITISRTDDIMMLNTFVDDADADPTTVMDSSADDPIVDLNDPFYDDETRLAVPGPTPTVDQDSARNFEDKFDDNFDDDDTAPRGGRSESALAARSDHQPASDTSWNPPSRPRRPGGDGASRPQRTLPAQFVAPLIIALILVIIIMGVMLSRGDETDTEGNGDPSTEQIDEPAEADADPDVEQDEE